MDKILRSLFLHAMSPRKDLLLSSFSQTSIGHLTGLHLHAHALKSGRHHDAFLHNSLAGSHSSSADLLSRREVFDEIALRDVVPWTTLITAYRKARNPKAALDTFQQMRLLGVPPNRVTAVNLLAACACRNSPHVGVPLHSYAIKKGWETDVVLGTALLDMYGKCGLIGNAICVFKNMPVRNVYTWNSMISSVGGGEAVRLFFDMERAGLRPDAVTLLAVLKACSRARLVREGEWFFQRMREGKYGFKPGVKHYGCVVDMFGRAGLLEEALEWIEIMPFEPGAEIWRALLGGCRANGNSELAALAARKLAELELRQ